MTDLLVRAFIKNYDEVDSPRVRSAYGKLAGFTGIVCNVLLFAAKLTVGTLTGSVAVTADAVNNLSDAASSIISLLGFKMAAKPADADHPFGHARYEYLAGLIVAILILNIGIELLKSGVEKLIHPSPIEFSFVTVGVLLGSILVKLWMALFNRKIGKRIGSQTLEATAADSRNDVISSAAVLVSVCLVPFAGAWLDGVDGPCRGRRTRPPARVRHRDADLRPRLRQHRHVDRPGADHRPAASVSVVGPHVSGHGHVRSWSCTKRITT